MGDIISVASGKGGVGKTTLTAAISLKLAEAGHKVLVIDADIGLRNMDLHFDLKNDTVFDILDVYKKQCSLDQAAVQHSVFSNLYLLSAPWDLPEDISAGDLLESVVRPVKKRFDYIFIDCPAGIGRIFDGAVKCADRIIIVATPDFSSMRDADRVAGILSEKGKKNVRLVVNRVKPKLIKKGILPHVDDIIDGVSVQLLGIVPDDDCFVVAKKRRRNKSKSFRAVANIARRINGENVKLYKFW